MPIYEYECQKCGHIQEVWQSFSDAPLNKCGHCKGKLRKMISQSTFHLKGSGWYATDYASKSNTSRNSNSNPKNNKESSAESPKAGATETSKAPGETKTATPQP